MTEQITPERRKVTMMMAPELHRALKVAAAEDDRTVTDVIEELVKAYLEERRKQV